MNDTTVSRRRLLQIGMILPGAMAGCSLGGGQTPRKFSLSPLAAAQPAASPSWTLAVAAPRALKSLDSERIAHRPDAHELQYYADADWIDRAPLMLQMLMIRSFQNRTGLQVAANDMPGPLPEFLLTSILQDFQSENGQTAHITLIASLARTTHRQIVETKNFEASATAASDHIEPLIAAFDDALHQAMTDLIAWTIATGEAAART